LLAPSGPGDGGDVFYRYKLHYADGSDVGEAAYADNVNPGDEIMLGPGRFVRVLAVVPVDEISPYTALLQVEPVEAA
jgi:hypothetical protein